MQGKAADGGGGGGGDAAAPNAAAAAAAAPAAAGASVDVPKLTLERGCMGGTAVRWWMVNALEGREVRFCELLLKSIRDQGGLGVNFSEEEPEDDGGGDAPAAPEGALVDLDGTLAAWVPQKRMKVYSPSNDKLVSKVVQHTKGVVFLRCQMSNDAYNMIVQAPFFQGWRPPYMQEYSGALLERNGLLPPGESANETYQIPIPIANEAVQELLDWQADEEEAEDLEARRLEVYGNAGGDLFGVTGRRDLDAASFDKDENGRRVYKKSGDQGDEFGGGYGARDAYGDDFGGDDWGAAPRGGRGARGGYAREERDSGYGGRGGYAREERDSSYGARGGYGNDFGDDLDYGGGGDDWDAAPRGGRGQQRRSGDWGPAGAAPARGRGGQRGRGGERRGGGGDGFYGDEFGGGGGGYDDGYGDDLLPGGGGYDAAGDLGWEAPAEPRPRGGKGGGARGGGDDAAWWEEGAGAGASGARQGRGGKGGAFEEPGARGSFDERADWWADDGGAAAAPAPKPPRGGAAGSSGSSGGAAPPAPGGAAGGWDDSLLDAFAAKFAGAASKGAAAPPPPAASGRAPRGGRASRGGGRGGGRGGRGGGGGGGEAGRAGASWMDESGFDWGDDAPAGAGSVDSAGGPRRAAPRPPGYGGYDASPTSRSTDFSDDD
ncbi:MAG: hypothetical protein J3K34DRAFT_527055 [Monoraphidium minutum]|nr:MAG: hypothetical protein J3K34DRAFT_527055 [Monoraphidium minutum]